MKQEIKIYKHAAAMFFPLNRQSMRFLTIIFLLVEFSWANDQWVKILLILDKIS